MYQIRMWLNDLIFIIVLHAIIHIICHIDWGKFTLPHYFVKLQYTYVSKYCKDFWLVFKSAQNSIRNAINNYIIMNENNRIEWIEFLQQNSINKF